VRLAHYAVPAVLPEARPESLLSPLAPCKAINALGSGRRPGCANPGLGIDDCREIGVLWHSWRFGICGNRRSLRMKMVVGRPWSVTGEEAMPFSRNLPKACRSVPAREAGPGTLAGGVGRCDSSPSRSSRWVFYSPFAARHILRPEPSAFWVLQQTASRFTPRDRL